MDNKTLITKSITVFFIDEKERSFEIDIPFSSIFALEMEDVTTTVGHTSKGEFLEFLKCSILNLRIYKDKVDENVTQQFKDHSILSIRLNFDDDTSQTYNVRWYSDDKIVNKLQKVYIDDKIIRISVDEINYYEN